MKQKDMVMWEWHRLVSFYHHVCAHLCISLGLDKQAFRHLNMSVKQLDKNIDIFMTYHK